MMLTPPTDFREFSIEHEEEYQETVEAAEQAQKPIPNKEKWLQSEYESTLGDYIDSVKKEYREY